MESETPLTLFLFVFNLPVLLPLLSAILHIVATTVTVTDTHIIILDWITFS